MMIQTLILLVAGILATRPAAEPDGRMLTVAESVGQTERPLSPTQVRAYWTPDSRSARAAGPSSSACRSRRPVPRAGSCQAAPLSGWSGTKTWAILR